ncbi:CDP-alcohol phosphatidyltransferase family protein [Candidatus Saccharibacteria bacterium]|nr:CDP-alcohol phosphatidyltransferase family protein [Candidatus Saccharibacteria bacterium]
MQFVDVIRQSVRKPISRLAKSLDSLSKGKISPDSITIAGFLAHIPIALLIAYGYLFAGALLLIVFGLFDTLDGELARLQKRASPAGMLLDASTDRLKEVLLYGGAAYYLSTHVTSELTFVAVIACGASLCVSYVKAKGESAVATSDKKPSHTTLNKLFADGLATFEIRMLILIIGLLTNQLLASIIIIAILSIYTAVFRLIKISRYLNS